MFVILALIVFKMSYENDRLYVAILFFFVFLYEWTKKEPAKTSQKTLFRSKQGKKNKNKKNNDDDERERENNNNVAPLPFKCGYLVDFKDLSWDYVFSRG